MWIAWAGLGSPHNRAVGMTCVPYSWGVCPLGLTLATLYSLLAASGMLGALGWGWG